MLTGNWECAAALPQVGGGYHLRYAVQDNGISLVSPTVARFCTT